MHRTRSSRRSSTGWTSVSRVPDVHHRRAVSSLNSAPISASGQSIGAPWPVLRNESTQICDQVSNSCADSADFRQRQEFRIGQALFPRHNVRVLELEEVDDTQVNLADGRGIVVDQARPGRRWPGLLISTSSSISRLIADS